MKKVILLGAIAVMALSSCNQKEIEYLNFQKDSIEKEKKAVVDNMNNYLAIIEDVQSSFRNIKSTELGILEEAQDVEGVTSDSKDRIKRDFQTISNALNANRVKLDSLSAALEKAGSQASYFRGLVSGLQRDLKERSAEVNKLKSDLEQKSIRIAELDTMVANLNLLQDSLTAVSTQQAAAIQAQDEALNTVYYMVGDKKELAAKGLKESMLRGANVNKGIFTKVDMREFTQLELNSKKAVVLTNHPSNSYTLTKKSDSDKNLVLTITNYNSFWANSKILVVQVK